MKRILDFLGTKMLEKSIGKQATEQDLIRVLTNKEIWELRRRRAQYFNQFIDDVFEHLSDSEKALMWLEYVGIPDHNKLINEIGR